MAMRNMFVVSRSCKKIFNELGQLRVGSPLRCPATMTNSNIKHFSTTPINREFITFRNHDDFVKKVFVENNLPVIVDFHADWCEPSKLLTNNLKNKIEFRRDLALVIVNVESNIDLVHTFEVKAVPAVLAVKNGLVVYKYVGLLDGTVIEEMLDRIAGKDSATRL